MMEEARGVRGSCLGLEQVCKKEQEGVERQFCKRRGGGGGFERGG